MPLCDEPRASLSLPAFRLRLSLGLLLAATASAASATTYPITPEQRATATQVAQAGVPLSELAPGAPDSHTVKPGDTLWDISKLFLKSPWRWPELWGMNKDQIANPHLIYPGQILVLIKVDGRARLVFGQDRSGSMSGLPTEKLSPSVRSSAVNGSAITAIPQHLIEPFLTDAVVFETDELARAPRIVAAPENHVLLTRGDTAYARGDLSQANDYRVFRTAKPLKDPGTGEILGYEAPYLGTAELIRHAEERKSADGKTTDVVPASVLIKNVRQEIGVGDRLSPVPQRSYNRYLPHAPSNPVAGQIVAVYGEALRAGQNQIVSLNRGSADGLEHGHVLALWTDGRRMVDRTGEKAEDIKLPDERQGVLFVFQVYKRVSYALIISVNDAVGPGDRFTQP